MLNPFLIPKDLTMTRFAPLVAAIAILAAASAANAQYYTTYYAPAPAAYYPAPVTAYYAPAPVATYYAPAPVYVAPRRAYYGAPVVVAPLRPWRYRYAW